MNIVLSWDLFVIVFFVVIIAYSFIIGRDNTLKVILGTYVSMIAADASGNLFQKYFAGSELFMRILSGAAVETEAEAVVLVKVVIFVALVILFAVRGAFEVSTIDDRSVLIRVALSILYAVMSAGLIISAILIFVSGVSFIGAAAPDMSSSGVWDMYSKSRLIKLMIENGYLWFCIPALSFLIHSLYTTKGE